MIYICRTCGLIDAANTKQELRGKRRLCVCCVCLACGSTVDVYADMDAYLYDDED